LWRGRKSGHARALLRTAATGRGKAVKHLENEYEIRGSLDSNWAAVPLAIRRSGGLAVLVLSDPGGILLADHVGSPMEILPFLDVAVGLAESLSALHGKGLIHKDIKPSNILIAGHSNKTYLTGFGFAAKSVSEQRTVGGLDLIPGTFAYMAPEQTGRMNRSVDARSDLYSFGVVCYQLLTGTLPFSASDPMGWIHCHIARQPVFPVALQKEIPLQIALIVLKLLSKSAEDRYQSAEGAAADLKRCREDWLSQGAVSDFALAALDKPTQLTIPERLYGRETECKKLLETFDQVCRQGVPRLVLVSGYSGVGKSAVINEMQKAVVRTRGIFVSGKFEQYKQDISYFTFSMILQGIVREILNRSEIEKVRWRDAIVGALGTNGQLIVDLAPDMKMILGPQPVPHELPAREADRRLRSTIGSFLGALTGVGYPLVLFLDDLQWVDAASLKVVEEVIIYSDIRYLMLVGAFRINEVSKSHALYTAMKAIRGNGLAIETIALKPLSRDELGHLIADTLGCRPDQAETLIHLVYDKTSGNPFFAIQFLTALKEERLLEYDVRSSAWHWDIDAIHAKGLTDNVVELMVAKLRKLPRASQKRLMEMACLGIMVPNTIISILNQTADAVQSRGLDEAINAGFLIRHDDHLKFVHDRVQEAAYGMINLQDRPAVHLNNARRMLKGMDEAKLDGFIYDIVGQFNRGIDLISAEEEEPVFRLNCQAGRKAKLSGAHAAASSYFSQAARLLPMDSWQTNYDDTFLLYADYSASEFLLGNHEAADEMFGKLLSYAPGNSQRAQIYRQRISLYQVAGRFDAAVDASLEALAHFGIVFPTAENDIAAAVDDVRRLVDAEMLGRTPQSLYDSPVAVDQDVRAVLGILGDAMPCAYFARPALYPLFILTALHLTVTRGNTQESCAAYMGYAILLASVYKNVDMAFMFSNLAMDLKDRFSNRSVEGTLLCRHGLFINSQKHPIADSIEILERAFRSCVEVGNLVYAGYSALDICWLTLEKGEPLEDVAAIVSKYEVFARQSRHEGLYKTLAALRLFIDGMRNGATAVKERKTVLEALTKASFGAGVAYFNIVSLKAATFYGRHVDALEHGRNVAPVVKSVMGWVAESTYHFYNALALTSMFHSVSPERQRHFREQLR